MDYIFIQYLILKKACTLHNAHSTFRFLILLLNLYCFSLNTSVFKITKEPYVRFLSGFVLNCRN